MSDFRPVLNPNQIAGLRAVARAVADNGGEFADTVDVANALGRERPNLLNTKRERLMSQLRRIGAIEIVRHGRESAWRVTYDGRQLLDALSL